MTTIALLHALGLSHRMWERQVADLKGRYRILAPDLPGHGGSPGPFTLARAIETVVTALRAEDEPVHLCGLSLGATVAIPAALAAPDRVRSLVLSGAIAHAPRFVMGVQRIATTAAPWSTTLSGTRRLYARYGDEVARTAVDDMRTAGKQTLREANREMSLIDLRPRLREIRRPTLVLCGGDDRANFGNALAVARGIQGAQLQVIPDAGHLWSLEFPETFTRTLSGWVESVERGVSR
ncbi:MAG TPA: alpha/beta fold hydrolase [Streptosporangiaceae bacterium]